MASLGSSVAVDGGPGLRNPVQEGDDDDSDDGELGDGEAVFDQLGGVTGEEFVSVHGVSRSVWCVRQLCFGGGELEDRDYGIRFRKATTTIPTMANAVAAIMVAPRGASVWLPFGLASSMTAFATVAPSASSGEARRKHAQ
jgi:hypothetical protein